MPVYGALVGIGPAFGGIIPDHDLLTGGKKDSRDLLPLIFYCPGALDRNQRTWFEEILRAHFMQNRALLPVLDYKDGKGVPLDLGAIRYKRQLVDLDKMSIAKLCIGG
jgi:hypothetical protein